MSITWHKLPDHMPQAWPWNGFQKDDEAAFLFPKGDVGRATAQQGWWSDEPTERYCGCTHVARWSDFARAACLPDTNGEPR